jgi:PAS domain S-box-containing protein
MTANENFSENRNEDITHQELKDSQARLSGIIESAMDAIISVDENYKIQLFNRSAEKVFGYPTQEMIGKPVDILIPERFRDIHREHIHQFGETGVTNRGMGRLGRLYGLRANGEEFQIEASISQVNAARGKLFTVILRDITERIKAEDALIEGEQHLRATFDLAAVGIAHIAPDGHWLRVNRRLCEITGYSLKEITTMKIQQITHPDDLEIDNELREQLIAGKISSYAREKRYINKEGKLLWVSITASLVRERGGKAKYFINIIEDITQRKKTEDALQARNEEISAMTQQLWQTAKLATMGELAASVAHELNNPLAILSLRIESLLSYFSPEQNEWKELKIMEQEAERMASLVSNLLQFSRSSERQISSLDIRDEFEKTLELVHNYLVNRHINVHKDYSPNIPLVQADRQQLRQLFLNLITNAIDAMTQGGGTLNISIQPELNTRFVLIFIKDSGTGISPEHISRIMDPFFSTKPEGKGTGLGLSICRRIVEEHKGTIRITSAGVNMGTEVEIHLPKANETRSIIIEE